MDPMGTSSANRPANGAAGLPESSPTQGAAVLPEAISDSLLTVVRRSQKLAIVSGLLRTVLVTLVLCLAMALLLGSFPTMPSAIRWALTLATWGALGAATFILLRPALKPIQLRQAANIIHASHRDSHERIISAVEFTELENPEQTGSTELIQHVIHQAETDARAVQPRQVLSVFKIQRLAIYCAPALLAWMILWPLMPQRINSGLSQTFLPWRNVVTGSDLNLQVLPGDTALATGDRLLVTVRNLAADDTAASGLGNINLDVRYPAGGDRTIAMTASGPKSFRHDFSSVISSFRYRISCPRGVTRWYHVNALVRPAVQSLEIHYTYPVYTRLASKVKIGQRGAIRAIRGTTVQVVVHSSQPLKKSSNLEMGKGVDARILPLTHLAGLTYQATFHVLLSGVYRINLTNTENIRNSDNRPWPIEAIADQPPVIHITSPAKIIRVRPDDTIPISFTASDDFGLTRLEAIVSVDKSASLRYHIPLEAKDLTHISRNWKLSVADQLLAANQPRATKIFYRLSATDNCQPAGQTTRTGLYELILDANLPLDYQSRMNEKAYHHLHKALVRAITHLGHASQQMNNLRWVAPGKKFTPAQAAHAAKLQDDLARAAANLRNESSQLKSGPYAQTAAAAQQITRHSVEPAANDVAAAMMNSPTQVKTRQANLTAAQRQIATARQKLQHLLWNLNKRATQQHLVDSVQSLAQAQQHVSQQLAMNPESASARRSQAKLQQQLKNLIKNNKVLQTPAAASVQPMLNKLKQDVGQIISGQTAMNKALAAQLAQRQVRSRLKSLAQKQKALNKRISRFETQVNDRLQKSGAASMAPPKSILNAAQNNLQQHELDTAGQNQRRIASDLNQTAAQLAKSNQPPTTAQQAQQQQAANLNQASKAAEHNAGKLQSALHGQPSPDTIKNAIASARQLHFLAQQFLNQNPTPNTAAALHKALNQADAAQSAANEHNARQTRNALSQAGALVRAAARANLAAKAVSKPSPAMTQSATKARQLADAQNKLAAETAKQLQQLQRAANQNTQSIGQQGAQMASQMQKADALAKAVEHQTADGAPDLARSIAQARQQIQAARQAQTQANQAGKAGNSAMAQEHQQSALLHMQLAQGDLNGLLDSPEVRNIPQYNDAIAGQVNPNQPNQATPPKPANGSQAKPSPPPPHANSLYDRLMAAAQQMHNALASQAAAQAGNAAAAQQAAHSLSAASQNLGQPQPGQGNNSGEHQGNAQANGQGQQGQPGQPGQSGQPGQALAGAGLQPGVPGDGFATQSGGSSGTAQENGTPPKVVTQLGVSPAEWRNLGPLRQKQLLDTARQNIPPGYRRMVRDYYLRLAKMHGTD